MAAIGPVPSGRVELLSSNLGPAAAATSMRGPSDTCLGAGWTCRVVYANTSEAKNKVLTAGSHYSSMNHL